MQEKTVNYYKIHLSIGDYCSQSCIHCPSSRLYSSSATFYSLEEILKKFHEKNAKRPKHQPIHVVITGGEPLEHPEIIKIIESLSSKVDFLSLSTNGLKLAEHTQILLTASDLGLDEIALSTEYDSHRYRSLRQTNSHALIGKLVYLLKTHNEKLIVSANIVIDKSSFDAFEQVIEALEKTSFDRIKIIPYRELTNSSLTPLSQSEFKTLKSKIIFQNKVSNKTYSFLGLGFKEQYLIK